MDDSKALFIVWKPEYSVGNAALDSQHRKMFDIINGLYRDMSAGISDAEFQEHLEEALRYAAQHFRTEEVAMKRCGFGGLREHQRWHRAYEQKVRVLAGRSSAQADAASSDLLGYLKTWWKGHICTADQAYAPFLNRGGRES